MVYQIAGFFSTICASIFNSGALCRALEDDRPTEEILPLISESSANEKRDDKTALHLAFERKRFDLVEALLDAGADPFVIDETSGNSSLHLALLCQKPQLFKKGLNSFAKQEELDCKNSLDDRSLLLLAADLGDEESVALLLEKGASVNLECGNTRLTALHAATAKGHVAIIKLLHKHRANIHCRNRTGETPIFIACAKGTVDVVSALLQLGAQIDGTWQNQAPLHVAIRHGHEAVVKLLLERGINLLLPIYKQQPPLLCAIQEGKIACARKLLEHNLRPDALHEPSGESAFHVAAKNDAVAALELFCEFRVPLNHRTKVGKTALYLACEAGSSESAKLLMQKEAALEEKCGPEEKTALQIASESGHLQIIGLLLENGAKFSEINRRYLPAVVQVYIQHHHTRFLASLELLANERSLKTQLSLIQSIQIHFRLETMLQGHPITLATEEKCLEKIVLGVLELQEHLLSVVHKTFDEKFNQSTFTQALVVLVRQHTLLQLLAKTRFFPLLLEKTALSSAIILSDKFTLGFAAQQDYFKAMKEKHCKEQQALEQLVIFANESCKSIEEISKIHGYYFHDAIRELYTVPLRRYVVLNQTLRQDCLSMIQNLKPRNRQQEFDEEDVFGILEKIFVAKAISERGANNEARQDCLESLIGAKQDDIWHSGLREGVDLRLIGIDDDLLILIENSKQNSKEISSLLEKMRNSLLPIVHIRRYGHEAKKIVATIEQTSAESRPEDIKALHRSYCILILSYFLHHKKDEFIPLLKKHQCESLSDLQKKEPQLKFR